MKPALAQGGESTTDIINGRVLDEEGEPLEGVSVDVMSLETEVTRSTRTNAKGRFTVLFSDGGGQYRVTFRVIGYTAIQKTVIRQADEDRIIVNVRMTPMPTQLEDVVVESGRQRRGGRDDFMTPGSTERRMNADLVARLPLDASDLILLAMLVPGVVTLSATDSTLAGFSVGGLQANANNVTLDGLSFGGSGVPQDAVRNTRVITSTYDASRGQFSGGLISSTTRSGTNRAQLSGNYGFRDRSLVVTAGEDDPFASGFSQHQLSFGLGGPLIRNKLFLFFSGQGRFRGDELQSLLSADDVSKVRLGLAPDSAARLISVLENIGVPVDYGAAERDRNTDDLSSIVRLDYLVSQSHTVTIRGDYRDSRQDPTRIGSLSIPASDTRSIRSGGGLMVVADSRFGTQVINQLRGYWSTSSNEVPAGAALPAGRVQVISDLETGLGATNLSFGGIPGLPQESSTKGFEASNELSWIPGDGGHRLKLGGFVNWGSSRSDASRNRYGTFTFNSIEDLEAGRPSSFSRTLTPTIRSTEQSVLALYGTDSWRASDALQLTGGVRLEGSDHSGQPALNSEAQSLFGIRTDRWPSGFRASPRVGFTYMVRTGDDRPPSWVVRGGWGLFRSPTPGNLFSAAQVASGFGGTESQLFCVGTAAPTPNWLDYLGNPDAIPTECADGGSGTIIDQRPNIVAFGDKFSPPGARRSSIGLEKRRGFTTLSVELSRSIGISQTGTRDLNLGDPQFTLGGEGRPVYVPADAIDTSTGTLPFFASRRVAEYGSVLLYESDLKSRSTQLTLSANGTVRTSFFNLSYTWSRTEDQRGSGLNGTTAGDPNVREWGTSDLERKHSFLASFSIPVIRDLEVTTIARFSSGTPYTPMVGSDINGDGSRNDRAFIFGANAGDTAIANGMTRLLASTSGSARECLEKQTGRIAGHNSCRGPWQTSLDLQINFRPNFLNLRRRATFSLVTSNLLVGIDRLLHGGDNIHGWGQNVRPDGTLLVVRGFDPNTNTFTYAVNERFGASRANTIAIRQPFQIGIQVRYGVGGGRGGFGGGRGGGGFGGGGQGGGTPAEMIERFTTGAPNPAADILEYRIMLKLSDAQVAKLETLSDSLKARTTTLADSARKELEKAGPNPDQMALMSSFRPIFQAMRENRAWALKEAEGILTPEQWKNVPPNIKSQGGPGGRGGNNRQQRR